MEIRKTLIGIETAPGSIQMKSVLARDVAIRALELRRPDHENVPKGVACTVTRGLSRLSETAILASKSLRD